MLTTEAANSQTRRPWENYLSWDVLFMGGIAVLMSALYWSPWSDSVPHSVRTVVFFVLAMLVTAPHYAASYLLLYGDFRKKILKRQKFIFSAILFPVLLFAALAFTLIADNRNALAWVFTTQLMLGEWHYYMQTFGCVLTVSKRRKIYYSRFERRVLGCNIMALVLTKLTRYQMNPGVELFGLQSKSLMLPSWCWTVAFTITMLSLAVVIYLQIQRYRRHGVKPVPSAVAALLAAHLWAIPPIGLDGGLLIQNFHALQYLMIVWIYKKSRLPDSHPKIETKFLFKFFATAIVFGFLGFAFIPGCLDQISQHHFPEIGAMSFTAAILLFINLHHYIIDSTIWRSDNELVEQHLFKTEWPGPVETAFDQAV